MLPHGPRKGHGECLKVNTLRSWLRSAAGSRVTHRDHAEPMPSRVPTAEPPAAPFDGQRGVVWRQRLPRYPQRPMPTDKLAATWASLARSWFCHHAAMAQAGIGRPNVSVTMNRYGRLLSNVVAVRVHGIGALRGRSCQRRVELLPSRSAAGAGRGCHGARLPGRRTSRRLPEAATDTKCRRAGRVVSGVTAAGGKH
jgi:hypothetical protein